MNMKFKLKNLSIKVSEEIDVNVEELEIGYEDFKLSEVPAIIRESGIVIKQTMDAAAAMSSGQAGLNVAALFGGNHDTDIDEDFEEDYDDSSDEDDIDEAIVEDVRAVVKNAKPAKRSAGRTRISPSSTVDEDDEF